MCLFSRPRGVGWGGVQFWQVSWKVGEFYDNPHGIGRRGIWKEWGDEMSKGKGQINLTWNQLWTLFRSVCYPPHAAGIFTFLLTSRSPWQLADEVLGDGVKMFKLRNLTMRDHFPRHSYCLATYICIHVAEQSPSPGNIWEFWCLYRPWNCSVYRKEHTHPLCPII